MPNLDSSYHHSHILIPILPFYIQPYLIHKRLTKQQWYRFDEVQTGDRQSESLNGGRTTPRAALGDSSPVELHHLSNLITIGLGCVGLKAGGGAEREVYSIMQSCEILTEKL